MRINNKKFIYLISPNKITKSFYNDLTEILKLRKVSFFQLRLKNISLKRKLSIGRKIKRICQKHKTKFIANIIGSPGMNFIPINEKISPNQSSVSISETDVIIPPQREGSSSDQNFLGVRPENLKLVSENGIKGNIFGVEYLGSRKILTIETSLGNIKIRVDSDTNVKVNEQVQFNTLNDNQIIFDGSTDKAISSEFMV